MRPLLATLAACLLAAAPSHAIVGGSPASEEYPWMAAMMVDGKQVCGATLVHPEWVLTAAHCPEGENLAKTEIVMGRHKLSAAGGEAIPVDRVVTHENYNTNSIAAGHDLALMHLSRPSSRPLMRVVPPAEQALWAPDRPARMIGWGTYAFPLGDVHRSDDLMEVDAPMVSDADCEAAYDDVTGDNFDATTMVCAGEKTGLKGVCQGDSGGPLMVKDGAGAWVQVGVSSFATGCGYPLYYSVFNRIGASPLYDWIQANLPAPAPAPSAPAVAPEPPAAAPLVELSAPRRIGSRRVRVSSTGPVTAVKVQLLRRGRVVATGALRSLEGSAAVRLSRRLRPGVHELRLRATDGSGRAVLRTLRVRVTR